MHLCTVSCGKTGFNKNRCKLVLFKDNIDKKLYAVLITLLISMITISNRYVSYKC